MCCEKCPEYGHDCEEYDDCEECEWYEESPLLAKMRKTMRRILAGLLVVLSIPLFVRGEAPLGVFFTCAAGALWYRSNHP